MAISRARMIAKLNLNIQGRLNPNIERKAFQQGVHVVMENATMM